MSTSINGCLRNRHRVLPEKARGAVKADLRSEYAEDIAEIVQDATCGLLLKEVADHIERATGRMFDERQIQRWREGTERPAFEYLMAVPEFRRPIALGFARLAGFQIDVQIQVA